VASGAGCGEEAEEVEARRNEAPVLSTMPLALVFILVVVRVQVHAVVRVLVLIVRGNATALLLALVTLLVLLIPLSAHVTLCVYICECVHGGAGEVQVEC
jgi:hypothetical protein